MDMETGYSMTIWRDAEEDGWYFTLDAEYPETRDEPEYHEAVYASKTYTDREQAITDGRKAMDDWNLRHDRGEFLRPQWNLI